MDTNDSPSLPGRKRYGPIVNKFRSPTGIRYTKQLFWDQQQMLPLEGRLIDPMYTLYDDRGDLVNLRRVYVELGDPTGYQLAIRYLEDYSHWNHLMKSSWFREAKEVWDLELDAKLSSEGMATIRAMAEGFEGLPPASQLTAAKYLADKAYKPKAPAASRGRPSKEEIKGNLKNEAEAAHDIASDVARIRLAKG